MTLTGGVLIGLTLSQFLGLPVGKTVFQSCLVAFILFSVAGWICFEKTEEWYMKKSSEGKSRG